MRRNRRDRTTRVCAFGPPRIEWPYDKSRRRDSQSKMLGHVGTVKEPAQWRVYLRLVTIEAMRSLARNKVRSGLAILGIAVGVATVICVVAIGRAGTEQALAAMDALGD